MPAAYYVASGGVVREADQFMIPFAPRTKEEALALAAYLEWAAVPNLADADPVETVAQARTRVKGVLNDLCAQERALHMGTTGTGAELWWAERTRQAIACAADGSPEGGDYPLLDAEVEFYGTSLAAVAAAAVTQWGTLQGMLGDIEIVRLEVSADIAAATTIAEVDACLVGLIWPTPL